MSAIIDTYGNSVLWEAERQARRKAYTRGHYRILKARAIVHELDPSLDPISSEARAAIMLAYAMLWGKHTLHEIPETLVEPDFILAATDRMRDAGLWADDGKWAWESLDDDRDGALEFEFWLHALVAAGKVERIPGKGYRLRSDS